MRYLALILPAILFCSCVNTRYREYADNGQLKYDFKTYADFGVSSSAVMGDKLRTNPIPLIGGSQAHNYDITQTKSGQPSSIRIGDNFEITGTVVHSTGMAINWKGGVRLAGVIGKTIFGVIGIKALESNTNAKTGADVAKNQSGNGVKINDSNNKLEGLKSNNSTKVELEALKLE